MSGLDLGQVGTGFAQGFGTTLVQGQQFNQRREDRKEENRQQRVHEQEMKRLEDLMIRRRNLTQHKLTNKRATVAHGRELDLIGKRSEADIATAKGKAKIRLDTERQFTGILDERAEKDHSRALALKGEESRLRQDEEETAQANREALEDRRLDNQIEILDHQDQLARDVEAIRRERNITDQTTIAAKKAAVDALIGRNPDAILDQAVMKAYGVTASRDADGNPVFNYPDDKTRDEFIRARQQVQSAAISDIISDVMKFGTDEEKSIVGSGLNAVAQEGSGRLLPAALDRIEKASKQRRGISQGDLSDSLRRLQENNQFVARASEGPVRDLFVSRGEGDVAPKVNEALASAQGRSIASKGDFLYNLPDGQNPQRDKNGDVVATSEGKGVLKKLDGWLVDGKTGRIHELPPAHEFVEGTEFEGDQQAITRVRKLIERFDGKGYAGIRNYLKIVKNRSTVDANAQVTPEVFKQMVLDDLRFERGVQRRKPGERQSFTFPSGLTTTTLRRR